MKLTLPSIVHQLDRLAEITGRATAWLILAMTLLVCYDVMMRYVFQSGSVALQELEWHLFALIFLFGAAYTLKHDDHVRVDVLANSRFVSDKQRAWIEILGSVLFLMPFCALIIISGYPFFENAFLYKEGSPDPGGLPHRFILKGAMLVAFGLLFLQGVAECLRNIIKLQNMRGHD